MKTTIIIAIYWLFCIALTYTIRAINQKKNKLARAALTGLGIIKKPTVKDHLAIIFLKVWAAPIGLIVLLIDRIIKKTKTERIMEKKNKLKKETEEKRFSTKVEENLPDDIYTQVSKTMMDALIFGIFDDFEEMLDDAVETVLYQYKTIRGKAEVRAYWWDWRKRFVLTKKVTNIVVVMSRYYSHACVKVESDQLIMFEIEDGKIFKILSLPLRLTSIFSNDNMLNYPLMYARIKRYLAPLEESVDKDGNPMPLTDRMPCLDCGMESQDLKWYSIRIPDWSYNRWQIGQVSVCPKCGRVVEYKEIETIESEDEKNIPVEGSKYSDEGNVYSEYAGKMYSKEKISFIDNAMDEEIFPDLREVVRRTFAKFIIPEPSEIKPDEGYRFELTLPTLEGIGDITHIGIVDEEGNITEDLTEHLVVNATEMGVWQLYLLEHYYTVLPTVWHGGYNERKYILKETDIDDIIPLKFYDLSELKAQDKLMPCVTESSDEADGRLLVVHCCYWNKWEGLVRETVEYKIQNCRVISENRSKEELFVFHCGMWF